MKIKHHFMEESNTLGLFKDTKKFVDFKKKLLKLSNFLPKENPKKWGRKVNFEDNKKLILGNGFELFCELFVLHMGFHPHIGLANYQPVAAEDDDGIDAFAYNLNNELSAVQCKFVSEPDFEFTANGSNLPNFLVEATIKDIKWTEDTRIRRAFLITTAKGLHYSAIEKWHNRVAVINGNCIKQLVDNNTIFWNSCAGCLEEENG